MELNHFYTRRSRDAKYLHEEKAGLYLNYAIEIQGTSKYFVWEKQWNYLKNRKYNKSKVEEQSST